MGCCSGREERIGVEAIFVPERENPSIDVNENQSTYQEPLDSTKRLSKSNNLNAFKIDKVQNQNHFKKLNINDLISNPSSNYNIEENSSRNNNGSAAINQNKNDPEKDTIVSFVEDISRRNEDNQVVNDQAKSIKPLSSNQKNQENQETNFSSNNMQSIKHDAQVESKADVSTNDNNTKNKFLDTNIDLKRKKELLDSKLKQQKLQKRYEEVPFPSIKDRVNLVDVHFKGSSSKGKLDAFNNEIDEDKNGLNSEELNNQSKGTNYLSHKTNKTVKSEAEEVGEKILTDKPVFNKKKMKNKKLDFQE